MSDFEVMDRNAMAEGAENAAACMRALSNPARLLILCHLMEGERKVGELEESLGLGQAYVSQQLARLRGEGLVQARREGRTVFYTLSDSRVKPIIEVLYAQFCAS